MYTVYVMQSEDIIKIGYSTDIKRRKSRLNTQMPDEIKAMRTSDETPKLLTFVYCTDEFEARLIEAQACQHFKKYAVYSMEWFRIDNLELIYEWFEAKRIEYSEFKIEEFSKSHLHAIMANRGVEHLASLGLRIAHGCDDPDDETLRNFMQRAEARQASLATSNHESNGG